MYFAGNAGASTFAFNSQEDAGLGADPAGSADPAVLGTARAGEDA